MLQIFINLQQLFNPFIYSKENSIPTIKMTFRDYTFGYRILGEGLSSTVYKAKKNKSKQQFALKIIKEEFLKSQFQKKLLMNEIYIHEAVNHHKNFVRLIQHGKYANSYVFVMEICQKGSLGEFLQKNKKLTQVQAVYIIKEIIEAYKVLHSLKILHRDIKPGNILLTQNNQVKLCDFGLSIKINQSQHIKNYRIGTPCFMAPEVAKKTQFTPKSDIWSIGVTYFSMLTGNLPYKCQNYDNFLKQIEQTELKTIIPNDLSDFSKLFLQRTLQKDPSKRMSLQELFNFKFQSKFNKILSPLAPQKTKQKRLNKSLSQIKISTQKLNNQIDTSFQQNKTSTKNHEKPLKNFQRTEQTQSSQSNLKVIVQNETQQSSPTTPRTPRNIKTLNKSSTQKSRSISVSPMKNLSPNKNMQRSFIRQDEKTLMRQMQKITKVLFNQIDFLRYTVKIMNSLEKYFRRQSQALKQMMKHYICEKIMDLKSLPFIEKQKIKIFKRYPIYNQWTALIEDYERSLGFFVKGRFRYQEFENQLSKIILEIYLQFDKSSKTKVTASKLATLDHLICYRDLLQMAKKGEGYFLKNSMLNLILEGIQKMRIQTDQIQAVYTGITRKITNSDYS